MFRAEFLPRVAFVGEHVAGEDGQGDECGSTVEKDVVAEFDLPEGFDAELFYAALPAFQSQSSACSHEAKFAKFVIAETEAKFPAKFIAQLSDALGRTFHRAVRAQSNRGGVAGVISIGDGVIHLGDICDEAIQLTVLLKRMTQPDVAAVLAECETEEGILYDTMFVVVSLGLFRRSGVVDVAEDGDAERAAHGRSVGVRAGRQNDAERGAAVGFALNGDETVMFMDDAARDGKTKSGAIVLCGEERFKESIQIFWSDARACVCHGHAHMWLACTLWRGDVRRRDGNKFSVNSQRTVRSCSVRRIEEQVHEDLFELVVISVDGVRRSVEGSVERDEFAVELMLHHA